MGTSRHSPEHVICLPLLTITANGGVGVTGNYNWMARWGCTVSWELPEYREDHQALGVPQNRVGLELSVEPLMVNIFIFPRVFKLGVYRRVGQVALEILRRGGGVELRFHKLFPN